MSTHSSSAFENTTRRSERYVLPAHSSPLSSCWRGKTRRIKSVKKTRRWSLPFCIVFDTASHTYAPEPTTSTHEGRNAHYAQANMEDPAGHLTCCWCYSAAVAGRTNRTETHTNAHSSFLGCSFATLTPQRASNGVQFGSSDANLPCWTMIATTKHKLGHNTKAPTPAPCIQRATEVGARMLKIPSSCFGYSFGTYK